jgi:cytochrome c biogenesis factor
MDSIVTFGRVPAILLTLFLIFYIGSNVKLIQLRNKSAREANEKENVSSAHMLLWTVS